MLGHTRPEDETSTVLEHPKKLVHYDLRKHKSEWIDKKDRSKRSASLLVLNDDQYEPMEVDKARTKRQASSTKRTETKDWRFYHTGLTYAYKIKKILSVLNRIGKGIWTWHMDPQYQIILLTMKMELYQRYGFFVSNDLKRLLNLKSNLFLPTFKDLKVEASGAYILQKGRLMAISKHITKIKHWAKLDLIITLLPLDRLKTKTVPIKAGSMDDFITSVNEAGTELKILPHTSRDPDYIKLIYVKRMDYSNVAFVHLNEKAKAVLSINQELFWDHMHKEIKRDILPKQQSGGMMTIFQKELKTAPERTISWHVKQEVKLPSKYFSNGHDLCTYLNRGDKTQFDYEFGYDDSTNKFRIHVQNNTVVKLSKFLAGTLGFTNTLFHREMLTGDVSLLNRNINHFYIYANFIRPTEVGGRPVPLLRYSPIDMGRFGQTMYKEFLNKVYIPVSVSRLQHVEFGIYDDAGEPIKFEGGRTA